MERMFMGFLLTTSLFLSSAMNFILWVHMGRHWWSMAAGIIAFGGGLYILLSVFYLI